MADFRDKKIQRGKIEFWRNDVIGRTPFSTVFKGTFEGVIDVAVKRIPLDFAKLAENEIDVLLSRTDHDNVIKYYCKEEDRDFCYIAMQLCHCTLEEYVEKNGNYKPSLPNTLVEEILRGVAKGLSHIHKKDVIHRDIKPSNILLFVKENKLVAKISDFGFSRIIPDHQTVRANFSAGTDLFKAPELLTTLFSWRSDVYAFGLVIFYVLSKGKHLFNNNPSLIIKGKPVNLEELNGQPAALSLIKWLTAFKGKARPRMSEVLYHPFFWDDEKKLNFIENVHKIIEDKRNVFLKEVIEEDSHHVICSSPENCGNQQALPDRAACADWSYSLTPNVKADFRGKVNTKSSVELVCFIKKKFTHFYELKEAVKAEYGGNIEEFRRYWMGRFPSLVIHLWEKVKTTHLETLFSEYYPPEWVHGKNVNTTLLREIDGGELQELLNEVKRLRSKIREDAIRSAVVKEMREHLEVLLKDVTGRTGVAKRQQRQQQQVDAAAILKEDTQTNENCEEGADRRAVVERQQRQQQQEDAAAIPKEDQQINENCENILVVQTVAAPPPPLPGSPPIPEYNSRYLNDFEPVKRLGRGGFGLVFQVRNRLDDCHYAVKRIRLPNSGKDREDVEREVRALAKLDDPHIVRYFNAWLESPPPGWQEQRDQEWKDYENLTGPTPNNTEDDLTSSFTDSECEASAVNHSKSSHDSGVSQSSFNNDDSDDSFKVVFEAEQSSKASKAVESFSINFGNATSKSSAKSCVATFGGNDIKETRLQQSTVYKSKTYLYIQMQLCQEMRLREWLKANVPHRDFVEVVHMFSEIVQAVEYVHSQGLMHRDLKPSNIFFAHDGKIKIGDFGLVTAMTEDPERSRSLGNPNGTSADTPLHRHTDNVGTKLYMSPEQIEGKPYNYKVDIYSLGLIFFELLLPFGTHMEQVKTFSHLKEGLKFPEGFAEKHGQEHKLLKKMLSPNPNERPTASEVLRSPPL